MIRTLLLLSAAASAVPWSAAAEAPARTEATVLMSENPRARAVQEQYGFAEAVIAGDFIFLSGIVAGKAEGETDMVAAYERAFRHIGKALERAGAGYGDVVDMTTFHTDINAEIGDLSKVSKQFLGSPPPAWTAIDVDRLLPDGGVTEIKIVALRRRGAAAGE